jgi:3' terminal RNA ribose 2'-O-methyltransferase Hen1
VLRLDIDTIGLVRGRRGFLPTAQYVNDRAYVASSFLSVAIADVFGSAMSGRSKERPELATTPLPLSARVAVLRCRAGEELLRRLFEPLGYEVTVASLPHHEGAANHYFTLELSATTRLSELLTHLYVLIPVIDDVKHYWVGSEEVEKLVRHGEGWLAQHPERDVIARRYLKHRRSLVDDAIDRLVAEEAIDEDPAEEGTNEEEKLERHVSLHEQRLATVSAVLKGSGARRVVDLGCGEGRLLRMLLDDLQFEEIVGMDVSYRTLERAGDRLRLDRIPPKQRQRIRLVHGSLLYRDARLTGFDAASVVEVIEHLDPPRFVAFERVVFEFSRPRTVVVTTPNVEYNVRWPSLPAGHVRHPDHRFEWTRDQFRNWATAVAVRHGYEVRFLGIGPEDPEVGAPTQMAIFTMTLGIDAIEHQGRVS